MSEPDLQPEDVLFLDAQLCVVNKPRGLPTQGRRGLGGPTLYEAALRLLGAERLWVVHWLDRVTSGALVLACTREAAAGLSAQFEHRSIRKTYLAWVRGEPPSASGLIDLPLTREGGRPRVDQALGKPARTRYRVLRRHDGATLLYLRPLTGRTHQLRVHLAAIGCPIWGDPIHGSAAEPEPCLLHALEIVLRHPQDGRRLRLRAPLRDGFSLAGPVPTISGTGEGCLAPTNPGRSMPFTGTGQEG
jgi:RluA family pseudouridine synthase